MSFWARLRRRTQARDWQRERADSVALLNRRARDLAFVGDHDCSDCLAHAARCIELGGHEETVRWDDPTTVSEVRP